MFCWRLKNCVWIILWNRKKTHEMKPCCCLYFFSNGLVCIDIEGRILVWGKTNTHHGHHGGGGGLFCKNRHTIGIQIGGGTFFVDLAPPPLMLTADNIPKLGKPMQQEVSHFIWFFSIKRNPVWVFYAYLSKLFAGSRSSCNIFGEKQSCWAYSWFPQVQ